MLLTSSAVCHLVKRLEPLRKRHGCNSRHRAAAWCSHTWTAEADVHRVRVLASGSTPLWILSAVATTGPAPLAAESWRPGILDQHEEFRVPLSQRWLVPNVLKHVLEGHAVALEGGPQFAPCGCEGPGLFSTTGRYILLFRIHRPRVIYLQPGVGLPRGFVTWPVHVPGVAARGGCALPCVGWNVLVGKAAFRHHVHTKDARYATGFCAPLQLAVCEPSGRHSETAAGTFD